MRYATVLAGLLLTHRTLAAATMTSDPDRDFIAAMIAQDQAAVDIARGELQYGQEPDLRAAALTIIESRQAEMARLVRWQETHNQPPH
ncbi:MAG: DUF305 domain-containing protein [Acetobacteraceae bacterium]|nr:DUF305 domain-containing protein [Acetobacteraceae bacterium]